MPSSTSPPTLGRTEHPFRSQRQPILLVIDDDETICELIAIWFEGLGWKVTSAFSGPEGVAGAQVHQPDVVLLGLKLPGYGGLEVLRRLRLLNSRAVVVVTSGWDGPGERAAAMVGGAADYVVKPLSLSDLQGRLQELLRMPGHRGPPSP